MPGAQNYLITATEREGEVVFLHRLERGRASKSSGIQVARLAGLPPAVLDIARQVLARLERYEFDVFAEEDQVLSQPVAESLAAAQGAGATDNSTTLTPEPTALDVAARRAGRRKAAAQASLFDLANQKAIEEIMAIDADKLSPEEAKELLRKLRERLM